MIQKAADAEQRAMEKVSSTIDLTDLNTSSGAPDVSAHMDANQGCSPCDMPDAVEVAERIQAVTTSVKDVPDNPRSPIPWWTDLEEEEEEEGGDEGGGQ